MRTELTFEVKVIATGERQVFTGRKEAREWIADLNHIFGHKMEVQVTKVTREIVDLRDKSLTAIGEE